MKGLLKSGIDELCLEVSSKQIDELFFYKDHLKEWNEKINLTAITDDKDIITKHFLDSMSAICTGKIGKKVIDVGCGAGFPGLVLKIMKPDISLTLLDSLKKRITFLESVSQNLGLENVTTVHQRAEDFARQQREKYDTVVSRAVANMTVLSELCLPFLKVGGYFLALKGPLADEELSNAKRAIEILGGKIESVYLAKIPHTDLNHKIIIVKKVRQTPIQYPRKPGILAKSPIGGCYNLKKAAKK